MTDTIRESREKIARMDDLVMDDLFSLTEDELLREAEEEGIDTAKVGEAGRAAFERAQMTIGRARLAIVKRQMVDSAESAPVIYDRAKARARLARLIAENGGPTSRLTLAARNEFGPNSEDMDGILDDFAELEGWLEDHDKEKE